MQPITDPSLTERLAVLIDRGGGVVSAPQLARIAGVSVQTVYNTRDGRPQRADTLAAVRRAVDAVEAGATSPATGARPRGRSVRIPMGSGVFVVVEDGADPATLARILRMDEESRSGQS